MSRDAGEDGKVLLAAALPKSLADNPNNNVGSFVVHYCKWSTTVTLCLVNCRLDYIIFFGYDGDLAGSLYRSGRTHNQGFVHSKVLVHSLDTVAAVDDGNYSLL